jgi:hypothetical protein
MARFTRTDLRALAAECSVGVTYYNPGDNPKYRVHAQPGADYFDGTGIFTGTVPECRAFILGMRFGRTAGTVSTKGGDA